MSGHRQAAVALYGLHAHDQRAILAELPEQDQGVLRGLLDELAELGFEPGAGIAEPAPSAPELSAEEPGDALRQALRRASPADMLSILGQEPPSLQACLLSLERWPWADGFIELLPPPRRAQVADALREGFPAAPARTRFLLESVAAELPGTPEPGAGARGGWLSRTLHKVAAWTR